MLEVFYGKDLITLRLKAQAVILPRLKDGGEAIYLEDDNYQPGLLLGLSETSSLFSKETVYVIDLPNPSEVLFAEFIAEAEALSNSANFFVVLVEALTADDKKKLKSHVSILEEYKKEAGVKFNPFTMAEVLALKDKKSLWFLLQEAKRNHLAAEEIIGTLWWQLKALRLAANTKNAEEAGMKDYPYNKAKRALSNFKTDEVNQLSKKLLNLYHKGHRGEVDLELSLEEWVLQL